MSRPSETFSWDEFRSKWDDVPVPDELRPNVCRVAAQLEVLRSKIGNLPIVITSGYRSPANNQRLVRMGRAAKNSRHMTGEAADI